MQNNSIKKYTGKIAAAIIEKDGKYFIAQRAIKDLNEGLWEFPGGKQEEGESIEECLRRELCEEFDIDATVGDYFCSCHFELFGKPAELCAYIIISFTGNIECREHNTFRWVTPDEFDLYYFPEPDLVIVEKIKQKK